MNVFDESVLELDCERECEEIQQFISAQTFDVLHKKGIVIAVSGGIDSSVTAALAARAVGRENVLALALPEEESHADSMRLSIMLADHLGIDLLTENITPVLEAFGCYRRRNEAIRRIFPEFEDSWRLKITHSQNLLENSRINFLYLVVENNEGEQIKKRLPLKELLEIIAATSHKQRTRKQFEYYHADRLSYAVAGTANRLEYDQGFFVKGGDGLADIKPIAHLYKTQVYDLARHLDLPDEIQRQEPSTDTYSLEQTQDEFYFSVRYDKLDLIMWALNNHIPKSDVADSTGLTEQQVEWIISDIIQKRRMTECLHMKPLLFEPVSEIHC